MGESEFLSQPSGCAGPSAWAVGGIPFPGPPGQAGMSSRLRRFGEGKAGPIPTSAHTLAMCRAFSPGRGGNPVPWPSRPGWYVIAPSALRRRADGRGPPHSCSTLAFAQRAAHGSCSGNRTAEQRGERSHVCPILAGQYCAASLVLPILTGLTIIMCICSKSDLKATEPVFLSANGALHTSPG